MRYIKTPDRKRQANAYIGKNVRTTSEEQGEVVDAYVFKGVVHLICERPNGGGEFTTDNEHATIWEPRSNL